LYVIDEEDSETLLLHRITPDDIYRKQEGIWVFPEITTSVFLLIIFTNTRTALSGTSIELFSFDQMISALILSDTIISWRDPEFSTELALSFQETSGCSYIW
jgi:protein phosphatase-4 regulatory subunit 3